MGETTTNNLNWHVCPMCQCQTIIDKSKTVQQCANCQKPATTKKPWKKSELYKHCAQTLARTHIFDTETSFKTYWWRVNEFYLHSRQYIGKENIEDDF